MGFLTELFNWGTEKIEEDKWVLGRFSDAYKPSDSYKKWEASIIAFEQEDYIKSIELFLGFLKDPNHDNLKYSNKGDQLDFEFYQGSKVIQGSMDKNRFRAESKIAHADQLNIGLLRRLLDRNYLLKYSRFALDESNNILIIFDSFTIDANPNKLYQGLKEISIQADKLDDIIVDEFEHVHQVNIKHIEPRPAELKEKQYAFLSSQLEFCLNEIENGKLNTDQFPGAISYLLLALNYKIDFLLKPEGFLMDLVEQNHRIYFANDGKEVAKKNALFLKSFRKIQKRKKEEILAEFYDVVSTFGVTSLGSHDSLVNFIQVELPKMEWYKKNNHLAIAQAIPSYIVGYCLFNYALPIPDMELLKLFYKITERDYFYSESEPSPYFNGNKLNGKYIRKKVEQICHSAIENYPNIKPDLNALNTQNLVEFSESFLNMICKLDLSRA